MNGFSAELIVVFVIVGAVILLWARSFYRMITGKRKGQCCGCGSCAFMDARKED
ncbi:MAG TPA: FeoB-associated Cys-rich membrane protein [Syntrophorhabdaceae bacterium]|nr:FeoB-associated Cys-rich membrane protein [Syntrophorhabdaceae bacterium]HQM82389.1 FeoB-associated Cys-rich membrane protein [Syntrophorhabdaceae bacterium]